MKYLFTTIYRGLTLSVMLVALLLMGCTTVVTPVHGYVYTDVQWSGMAGPGSGGPPAPSVHDAAAAPGVAATKIGKSCAQGVLGIATGDVSEDAAKKEAGITKVASVSHSLYEVLWGIVFARYCTIVRGE